ncbi:MAG: ATPase, T2SS/T4P/T4SS family, partial [Longimicrobiales bacterium]
ESLAEPVRRILRLSPDRIVVGEVRDHAAYYMLDAWLTGCPGSVATVHGSGPENALRRLDLLCQRANVPSQLPLIAAAVQLVVELRREAHVLPRVVDIARVDGLDPRGRFVLRRFSPDGLDAESSRTRPKRSGRRRVAVRDHRSSIQERVS